MSFSPTLLLMALCAAFGAFAAWFLCEPRARRLQRDLESVEADLKAQQASQAHIIHTTKLASLGQMVAGVAHEINTPLGFVKSNVEVVADLLAEHETQLGRLMSGIDLLHNADAVSLAKAREALTRARNTLATQPLLGDARDLLGDAADGLKSIAALVQNLKNFARVDRDGLDLVDLNDSVRSALNVAAHQLRERIKVVTDLGTLPKVRCMPSQLNQVFLNLVTNAAQAMAEEGTLTIATRAAGDAVEVTVSDTGSGIPEAVLPKIFDPFFTTKAVGEGTGLGLAIVHKIVKSHGGSIHVRTALGQGTTFTVSLPVEQRAGGAAPAQEKAA
jgi:two-component system NtrC family sensor kinase